MLDSALDGPTHARGPGAVEGRLVGVDEGVPGGAVAGDDDGGAVEPGGDPDVVEGFGVSVVKFADANGLG